MAQTGWSVAQWMALVGVIVFVWEAWTIVAWLSDSPYRVTEFQARGSTNWYAARAFEAVFLAASSLICVIVVRGCLRERRLTLDAKICIAGLTLFWADHSVNFFQPTFLISSNWINLNDPLGHMPFVVNPDVGRLPDPLLFSMLLESFILLGACKFALFIDRKARFRWPGISTVRRLLVLGAVGLHGELLLEGLLVGLGLWTYTSPPHLSVPINGYRLALTELPAGGLFFACGASIYVLRDDRGRTVIERGLERVRPRLRGTVSFLALYAALQFIVWIPATVPDILYGPYQIQWPRWPAWLVNGACDAPGIEGTRYGPCPGSPGYRMPGRHSLPGDP